MTASQVQAFTGRRAQACDCGECEPITIMTEPQRAADGSWEVLVMFDDRPGYLTPLKVQGYLWLKDPDAAPPEVEEEAPFIYATEGPRLELDAMLAALVQAVYGACEKATLCDAPMPAIDDVGIEEAKAIQRWAFEHITLPEPAAAPAAGEPAKQRSSIPAGWRIERLDDKPFKGIGIATPDGKSCIVWSHNRNPESVLYALAEALIGRNTDE